MLFAGGMIAHAAAQRLAPRPVPNVI